MRRLLVHREVEVVADYPEARRTFRSWARRRPHLTVEFDPDATAFRTSTKRRWGNDCYASGRHGRLCESTEPRRIGPCEVRLVCREPLRVIRKLRRIGDDQ